MPVSRSWLALSFPLLLVSAAHAQPAGLPANHPQEMRNLLAMALTHPPRPEEEADASVLDDTAWGTLRLGRHGVEMRSQFEVGSHPLELRVKGPFTKKRLGVRFEIRF